MRWFAKWPPKPEPPKEDTSYRGVTLRIRHAVRDFRQKHHFYPQVVAIDETTAINLLKEQGYVRDMLDTCNAFTYHPTEWREWLISGEAKFCGATLRLAHDNERSQCDLAYLIGPRGILVYREPESHDRM